MDTSESTVQLHQMLPLVERQHGVIEQLRARAPRATTGRELAEQLGVSTRTIERDVTRLREAGVPIGTRTGPAGGYTMDVPASSSPIQFTPGEISALVSAIVAVGPFNSASAQSVLPKLLATLHSK